MESGKISGSRATNGNVPNLNWNGDNLNVNWYNPGNANDNYLGGLSFARQCLIIAGGV